MRVGTWNLEGRWSRDHLELLAAQDCDVWLLTEVRDDTCLPGFEAQFTTAVMGRRKHWAGIVSRVDLEPLPDPHPASAAATGMGVTWCSSVLPWRSSGTEPWGGGTTAEKTSRAVKQLLASLPVGGLVWGGDWNHALDGPEFAGSHRGRIEIKKAVSSRRLKPVVHRLPHRIPGVFTIDHIAVPEGARITEATRVVAVDRQGRRLSDHEAYTTDWTLT